MLKSRAGSIGDVSFSIRFSGHLLIFLPAFLLAHGRYRIERRSLRTPAERTGIDATRALPTIMLGRMASAARLGTSGAADLSSEAATKDADATQAAAQGTSDDGPAGGTSAAAAATSVTTAAQQHPNLIGTIVGKMAKIQREGRGRRYRVSCFFGDACDGRSN